MMRARASAKATREVSIVIQRRPHCSATVGGRAGTASRVEHKVTGVGGHQEATFDDCSWRFEQHKPWSAGLRSADIIPPKVSSDSALVNVERNTFDTLLDRSRSICHHEPEHAFRSSAILTVAG